jgi:hypothetical protein
VREQLVRPDADDEDMERLNARFTPGLAGYVVMIGLGLFLPLIATLGYLALSLFLLVPRGLRRRQA